MAEYRFLTTFVVEVEPSRLYDGLLRPASWWHLSPQARRVEVIADGGADGLGARYEVAIEAVTAPYTMELDVEVVAVDPPHSLDVIVRGHLEGRGHWALTHEAGLTTVTWLWEVATTKTWMNTLGSIARPVFVHNHDLVMRSGIDALVDSVDGRLVDYRTGDGEDRSFRQRATLKVVEKATTLITAAMARDGD